MFFRKKRPAGNDNLPEPSQPTLIGAGTDMDGSIVSDSEVHIAGTLRGLVKAGICFIDTRGLVEGQIDADEVVVAGRVTGPVQARHVHLQAGCWVEGDITSDTIEVDNGAKLSGSVWQRGPIDMGKHFPALAAEPVKQATNFASESLWGPKPGDDYRPLKAVRPQR